MSELRVLWCLLSGDWRRSQRDTTLLWLLFSPLANLLVLLLVFPRVAALLKDDVNLTPFLPLVVGFVFLWITPLSIGLWSSLLFLEEREQGLKSFALLPINGNALLGYRFWLPGLYSFFVILLGLLLCGPAGQSYVVLSWVSVLGALQTPLMGMLFFRFSKDRVGALQLSKLLHFLEFLVVLAFFGPTPWQNLAGLVFPPYWVLKSYLVGLDDLAGFWRYLAIYLLLFIPLLVWGKKAFLRQYQRSLL